MAETKNFRHGHRERVRERFLREGLSRFADYEVLELLLFYAIPRRDTKEQAHALDDLCGSLYGALTASEETLCRVAGIGAHTAKFLRAVYTFMRYVAREEPHQDACVDSKELAERVYPYLDRGDTDSSVLLFMNNRDEVIRSYPLGKGRALTQINVGKIASLAFSYGAPAVLIADYKARGIPFPDDTVLQGMRSFDTDLFSMGITLRDYLLFTNSQYNSLFFLRGLNQLSSLSPFFLIGDQKRNQGSEQSVSMLADMLSFVMDKEKAKALSCDLLEKYGSLLALLSVPYNTLAEEYPNAEAQMLYLKIVADTYARTGLSHARMQKGVRFAHVNALGDLFVDMLGTCAEENMAAAFFDKDMRLIDVTICAQGTVNMAPFVMRSLIEMAVAYKSAYIAVAHNHPCGITHPSFLDTGMTGEVFKNMHCMNIGFVDHFVVTSTEARPLTRRSDLLHYADLDDSFYN